MARCPRSEATFLAAIDGSLTDAQRSHAPQCADCSKALDEARLFERELEASATQLAGPALPPSLLDVMPPQAQPSGAMIAAAAVAVTLMLVLVGGAVAVSRGYLAIGAPSASTPPPARYTLHVVVSNHRLSTATVEVSSTYDGREYSVSMLVPGCSGAYGAAPLGDSWRVRIGDYSFAVGPPSPTAGSASRDLTVRILNGVSGSRVLDGTPADNGLDVEAVSSATVAPCR
jgi:hypothetical protein